MGDYLSFLDACMNKSGTREAVWGRARWRPVWANRGMASSGHGRGARWRCTARWDGDTCTRARLGHGLTGIAVEQARRDVDCEREGRRGHMKGNCSPRTAGSGMVGVDGCWSAKLDGEFKSGRGNSSDGGPTSVLRRLVELGEWL
jgi:hypothetical protein